MMLIDPNLVLLLVVIGCSLVVDVFTWWQIRGGYISKNLACTSMALDFCIFFVLIYEIVVVCRVENINSSCNNKNL